MIWHENINEIFRYAFLLVLSEYFRFVSAGTSMPYPANASIWRSVQNVPSDSAQRHHWHYRCSHRIFANMQLVSRWKGRVGMQRVLRMDQDYGRKPIRFKFNCILSSVFHCATQKTTQSSPKRITSSQRRVGTSRSYYNGTVCSFVHQNQSLRDVCERWWGCLALHGFHGWSRRRRR